MNINRRIATELMGWRVCYFDKDVNDVLPFDIPENGYFRLVNSNLEPVKSLDDNGKHETEEEAWRDVPDFENNISHAMQAVEKARKKGIYVEITATGIYYSIGVFRLKDAYAERLHHIQFSQLPKTICEMILKVVDADETD